MKHLFNVEELENNPNKDYDFKNIQIWWSNKNEEITKGEKNIYE